MALPEPSGLPTLICMAFTINIMLTMSSPVLLEDNFHTQINALITDTYAISYDETCNFLIGFPAK